MGKRKLNVANAEKVLQKYLKGNKKRRKHSHQVAKTSEKLAQQFGVPFREAVIAALLHDIGKSFTEKNEMIIFCSRNGIEMYDFELYEHEGALHGRIAGHIFAEEFEQERVGNGFEEGAFERIKHAIEAHVAGSDKMSLLDKIIFVADNVSNGKRNNYMLKLLTKGELSLDDAIKIIIEDKKDNAKKQFKGFYNPFLDAYMEEVLLEVEELIQQGKLEEAEGIIKQYPNDEFMQAKMMDILIMNKEFEKAKEVGRQPIFEKSVAVQLKMVTVLIYEKNFQLAREIIQKFPDSMPMKSQMIEILIREGSLNEALQIGEQEKLQDDVRVQSQVIKIIILQAMAEENPKQKYQRALEIGKRFPDSIPVQSQMITVLLLLSNFEENPEQRFQEIEEIINKFDSPEIASQNILYLQVRAKHYKLPKDSDEVKSAVIKIGQKYPDNHHIQAQIVGFLFKRKEFAQAKSIAQRFPDNEKFQSQLISILREEAELADNAEEVYQEAIDIGQKFPDDPQIQVQIVAIHILRREFAEAERICKRFLPEEPTMGLFLKKIEFEKNKLAKEHIKKLKERIINRDYPSLEELNQYPFFTDEQRALLLLAIYYASGSRNVFTRKLISSRNVLSEDKYSQLKKIQFNKRPGPIKESVINSILGIEEQEIER